MKLGRARALILPIAVMAFGWLSVPSPADAQSPCRHVRVRSPFSNQTVRGVVPVLGSARIDDFGFYKVEWAPVSSPESWSAVSTTVPDTVLNGMLDSWDTTRITDGTYRLKLTAVDSIGQEPCRAIVERLAVANTTAITATATAVDPIDIASEGDGTPTGAGSAVPAGGTPTGDGTGAAADEATAAAASAAESADESTAAAASAAESADESTAAAASAAESADESAVAEASAADAVGGANDDTVNPTDRGDDAGDASVTLDGIAVFKPASWPTSLGLSALPMAFLGGALLAIGVSLVAIAVRVLRAR